MTEVASSLPPPIRRPDVSPARLARRHAAERRFRLCALAAVVIAAGMLLALIGTIAVQSYPAFFETRIGLDVDFDPDVIDPAGTRAPADLGDANYAVLVRRALEKVFPEVRTRRDRRALKRLLSADADLALRDMVLGNPALIGTTQRVWLLASDDVDSFVKGLIAREAPQETRRIDERMAAWIDALAAAGRIETRFNATFFTAADSREPEQAGILGAVVGSALTLIVTLALSFPLGVLAAIYLEEFAPRGRWADLIEVNINNLAAVPSIVFGLLGLAIFLNVFGLPRGAPVAGGMVLALMTLPTVIIAARTAIKAVPPSVREAALALGASHMQAVLHHVLPLALPGMLTGAIIGMARALGETAPLLMIGMVAFIAEVPRGFTDPATVLPVQIYLWADSPERAFVAKTSAATLVLLGFLAAMNAVAVILRRRFERRW
ncbi:MAG: phosphate ABC transporter permease PstA [Alphaproteobacteria bacterium]|nr:MAG: phosphate ABC transporter permease PstA [Alphaproteobacteria bacterium]